MNGRAKAIASGLLVTATSAVLVGSATAAATGSHPEAKSAARSRIHPDRPDAVSDPVGLPLVDPAVRAHSDAVLITRWVEVANAARWYEAATENVNRARAVAAASARRPASYRGGTLECIKHRESRGQYGVVNSSSGAAGAYQFMPGTWNNTARSAGRADLIGVNPSSAGAADQDAMAQHLLATQGLGPWGGICG